MQRVFGFEVAMFIAKTASRWERLGSRLSICKSKKPRDKLARALLAPEVPYVCGKRLLGQMPIDVLVHIFLYLDVVDVLSLAQVSNSRALSQIGTKLILIFQGFQCFEQRIPVSGRLAKYRIQAHVPRSPCCTS